MADEEMSGQCMLALQMAVGDTFEKKEVQLELWGPMRRRVRQIMAADPNLSESAAIDEASKRIAAEKVAETLLKKRMELDHERKQGDRRDYYEKMLSAPNVSAADAMTSMYVGSEKNAFGAKLAIDNMAAAKGDDRIAGFRKAMQLKPGLEDKASNWLTLGSERDLARGTRAEVERLQGNDSVDVSGDGDVNYMARAATQMLRDNRDALNDSGAWVPKRKGYAGRQNHDAGLVAGGFWREAKALISATIDTLKRVATGEAHLSELIRNFNWRGLIDKAEVMGFRAWDKFIEPKLHDSTYEDLDEFDLLSEHGQDERQALFNRGILDDPSNLRQLFRYQVWRRIVRGLGELAGSFSEADWTPNGASYARAMAKARTLDFKTPADASDYAERYTRGTYYSQLIQQSLRAGRTIALLERMGPDPERAHAEDVEWLRQRNDRVGGGQAGLAGLVTSGGKLSARVQAAFEVASGMANVPVSMRTAELFRNLRSWEAITKLGSVPLSKTADLAYGAQALARYGGMTLRQAYGLMARGGIETLTDADRRAWADAVGAGAQHWIGRMSGGWQVKGSPGALAWGMQMIHRISGFSKLNEYVERAVVDAMLARHGALADKAWGELPENVRTIFTQHAILPEEWDLVRQGIEPLQDGRRYLTFDAMDERVRESPELGPRAEIAKDKFRVLYQNVMKDAINEPRGREQVFSMTPFGSRSMILRSGTVEGELMRSFWQFKGFVNSAIGRHLAPAFTSGRPVSMLAHLIITTTIAGYVTMQLKALSRGELPKSAQEIADAKGVSLARAEMDIWTAAMAQGGGLGIYGDYLFGEANRNGQDFSPFRLGGPLLSDGEQVMKIVNQMIHGGDDKTPGNVPAELLRLGKSNIPVINTWYTRLGLDYMLMWRLQEMANPGYLERYQEKMERKAATHYWLAPTAAQ